jgi:hypothetical protein
VVTIRGGRHHSSAFRVCGCSCPYQGSARERVSVPWVDPGTSSVMTAAKQDHTRLRKERTLAAFEHQ